MRQNNDPLNVFHAVWDESRLHVWAETSLASGPAYRTKGRGRFAQKNREHPFALGHAALAEVASRSFAGGLTKPAGFGFLLIKLPSDSKSPLPSPEFGPPVWRKAAAARGLSVWQVPTLTLEAADALDWLPGVDAESTAGAALGSSVFYWSEMARLALILIAKGCFIPVMEEDRTGPVPGGRAVWEIRLSGNDLERMREWDAVMPPVARAIVSGGGRGRVKPQSLVVSFLNRTADAFVRHGAARRRPEPQVPAPRGARDDLAGFDYQIPSRIASGDGVIGNPARQDFPQSETQKSPVSIAEDWDKALCSAENALASGGPGLKDFSEKIQSWLRLVPAIDPQEPFRLCFKLEPPPAQEVPWRLFFYLQGREDPSLLIPAGQIWSGDAGIRDLFRGLREGPDAKLLKDLGAAARIFPLLEKTLKDACPVELVLTADEACGFLRRNGPDLQDGGFGVIVPAWWRKKRPRFGALLRISSPETPLPGCGMGTLLDCDWRVSAAGREVTPEEFEKIVRLKMPLVKIRGEWAELAPDEIDAALRFFEAPRPAKMILGEALRLGGGGAASPLGIPVERLEPAGWVRAFLEPEAADRTLPLAAVGPAFCGQLRPYQITGVSWLAFLAAAGFGACLADDMGLGKTIQLLAYLLYQKEKNGEAVCRAPTLLVSPMSIVGNWQREVERFAPSLKVLVHHGPGRAADSDFTEAAKGRDLVITTYALAWRDREGLAGVDWECLVLDEAQNIKNPDAVQARAVKSFRARHRIALTGTPLENRLSELWSIHDFLNPGYLGPLPDFNRRYAVPIEKHRDAGRARDLKRLIRPLVLRRLKSDKSIIRDLPEKMEMKIYCSLTREQAALYEGVTRDMLERIGAASGIRRRGLVLAALTKLKQICNHPAHFLADNGALAGRSGKANRLAEMLEEVLAEGDKALVFTQFAEMGKLLGPFLEDALSCDTAFLHGGTAQKERDRMVREFQQTGAGPSVLIASLKAGGLGLNLTAAGHVFHFDRWWNPAVEDQATDRAFRIGQTQNVQVHKLICAGTLEERIDRMIEEKKSLAARIVPQGEDWITEMPQPELEKILKLDPGAVEESDE